MIRRTLMSQDQAKGGKMISLKTRISDDNVRAEAVMTDAPSWAENDTRTYWYAVTLKRKRRQMTVPFGMGSALTEEPTAHDVLGSLLLDASGYENARSFEEWAAEYGYDADSRKAYATWELVGEQTQALRRFLGDAYDAWLWETDNDW